MKLTNFLTQVSAIAAESPRYRLGGDGRDGTCDCIGLIIGAIRRAGGSWPGTHGTNYAARYETLDLRPLETVSQLRLGDIVYKAHEKGAKGWSLPQRYWSGTDLRDYYHVGVVTSVSPLEITHCTTSGIRRDTRLGQWRFVGWLKRVNKPETPGLPAPVLTMRVTSPNGQPVKLRAQPTKKSSLYWNVPVGAEVTVLAQNTGADGWYEVLYGKQRGYMMAEFLTTIS